jgi:phage terminase large subunit
MHSVGKFLTLFRKLNLQSFQIGGDEGYGHQLMDRMQEEGFYLQRINNGSQAKRADIYFNLSAEWWSTVGQLIERRQIIIPNDEKLIAQLTSRRKLYDSKGRERLESKADLKSRGVESPDRADAIIGAIMMRLQADPYAFDPAGQQQYAEMLAQCARQMERSRSPFAVEHVNFNGW